MIPMHDFRITDIKILKDNKHIEMWGVVPLMVNKDKYEWAAIHFPKIDMSIQNVELNASRGWAAEIARECRMDSKGDVVFEIKVLDEDWKKRTEKTLEIMREGLL